MNHQYRKQQALLFLFTGFLLFAGLVVSCSAAVTPTEGEIKEMATKVESLMVGYGDGTSIQLARNTSQYEDVSRESLRRILTIDAQYKHVEIFDKNEKFLTHDEWLQTHKYVKIKFTGPTIIATKLKVNENNDHILSNDNGFRLLKPVAVLLPLSGSSRGEIWVRSTETKIYGTFDSMRPFSHLERIVDSLKETH